MGVNSTLTKEGDVERLKRELEEERVKAESYLTQLKYLQADFDNYRKKVEREICEAEERGKEKLIVKLLTIKDDLERAAATAKDKAVGEGLTIILNQLNKLLEEEGVVEIQAIGQQFDPEKHEAVAYTTRNDCEENTITSELRKGYMMRGRVIRTSIVEVSRRPRGGGHG